MRAAEVSLGARGTVMPVLAVLRHVTIMRAFCYSIRDKNYRQMRAYAFYGIQP